MVFDRLQSAGLKLKPKKCALFQRSVKFLGHVVSQEGVSCDPDKVSCVKEWKVPECVTEVRSFLGFASYYRRFIPEFAAIATPLTQLTRKHSRFKWDSKCQEAFELLIDKLATAPVLGYPRPESRLILDTDASAVAISGCLSQEQDGEERVLAYYSQTLSAAQRRYCTTKGELLAVVRAVKHFRMYLWGRPFLLRTDHASLRWLINFKDPEGMLARWISVLDVYDFDIQHRAGNKHANADGLTRIECTQCKRHECQGRLMGPGDSRVLRVYEDTLDLHEEHDIQDDLTFVTFPVIDQKEVIPELEKLQTIAGAVRTSSSSELSWLGHWTPKQLREWQDQDEAITTVRQWKIDKIERPPWSEVSAGGRELKALWSQWALLEARENLLYRRYLPDSAPGDQNDDSKVVLQLVAPKSLRKAILQHLHKYKTGGHLGLTKTLYNVRQRFYWPGQRSDVARWCHRCQECGARKPKKGKRAPLKQETVGLPMERIALDIMGPLPQSNSDNSYIFVIGDYFSKYTEAYALPDHTAQTVARVVVEQWICRYGVPRIIHSDQGRDFESHLFTEMCRLLDIDKTKTCPYRPQSDGMIERFNRTVAQILATFVKGNRKTWDEHLPFLMLAYRSTVYESTQCTPNELMYGWNVALPIDVIAGPSPRASEIPQCPVVYVEWLRTSLENSFRHARESLKQAASRQKKYYDQKAGESGFKIGDWVYRWYPPAAHGKFSSGWTGPYLVIQRLSDLLYRIQASKRAKPKVVHVDHLKKYYFEDDEEPANWLESGTGPAEDFRAQAEEGQGDRSQSGEVESPGDQSRDTDSENLEAEEFDDRQDPEVDPGEDSQVIESGEEEKLPYRHSSRQRRAPNRLNLRVKAGILDGFSLR